MSGNEPLALAFLIDSTELIDQSLVKLRNCLDQTTTDQVWWRPCAGGNSIGNLVLHICGNLRQWTLSGLGNQQDSRNRDDEFSGCHSMTTDWLWNHLESETTDCKRFLKTLDSVSLLSSWTIQGFQISGLQAVNHTVTHFVGHTHQVVLMTRMLLGAEYRFAWSPDDDRKQLPI